jgi:HEAT repeat protein
MPLRRAEIASDPPAPGGDAVLYLAQLAHPEADARRLAASALGRPGLPGCASAPIAAALAEALHVEANASVREAMFAALGGIGGAAAAALLTPFLRLDDAALRNGALETLKRLRDDAVAATDALLHDSDADVRLLAIEIMRGWPAALATPRLRALLETEKHVNVVGIALDVAAEVADAGLLASIGACRSRFVGHDFIGFAAGVAMDAVAARPVAPRGARTTRKPVKPRPRGAARTRLTAER